MAHVDSGDLAAAIASEAQAELLAERTAELLQDLDAIEDRLDYLAQLMLTMYSGIA